MRYDELVPIPPDGAMNGGLTSPKNELLLSLLGTPGAKTRECSPINGPKVKPLIKTADVGPFRATGLSPALASLRTIFQEAAASDPELVKLVHTAGMACCRLQRTSDHLFSNHSWGSAIDIYFGDHVVPQGSGKTHAGILKLYPFFHKYGWYWGAEFPSPDAMHFEVSAERLRKWEGEGLLG